MTLVNIYFTKREGPLNVPSEHFLIWWARKEEKRKAKARVDSGSRAAYNVHYSMAFQASKVVAGLPTGDGIDDSPLPTVEHPPAIHFHHKILVVIHLHDTPHFHQYLLL